jgi:hypothetical protein
MMTSRNMDKFSCRVLDSLVQFLCNDCINSYLEGTIKAQRAVSSSSVALDIILRNKLIQQWNDAPPNASSITDALNEQSTMQIAQAFLLQYDPENPLLAYFCSLGRSRPLAESLRFDASSRSD